MKTQKKRTLTVTSSLFFGGVGSTACGSGLRDGWCYLSLEIHVKHFLAMPLTLLLLPIVFFVCADAAGLSLEDCRARGLVPYPRGSSGIGEIWQIVNYHEVQWGMLPRQIANLIGLIIIVTTFKRSGFKDV